MKGGRLKIVNESSYPTDEVEALVRFGLSEIDLTGQRIVAVVKNTKSGTAYSGSAYALRRGIPTKIYNRYCGARTQTHHLIFVRIGRPGQFPVQAFTRRYGLTPDNYRTWQEALVGITAHEGKHAEHDHDGAYDEKSGRRTITLRGGTRIDPDGSARTITRKRIVSFRVGTERIEPKCEAFEAYMLRRLRNTALCA